MIGDGGSGISWEKPLMFRRLASANEDSRKET